MKKESLSNIIINTDADDSIKGIELQRYRAMKRLLESVIGNKKAIFCAVEGIDDVSQIEFNANNTIIQAEQDKNYQGKMSLNSKEVKNSIRIFLDTWRRVEESEEITFVFYSTSGISKENKVGMLSTIKEELPENGILSKLVNNEVEDVIDYVIPVIKDYYKQQYKKHSDENYHIDLIDSYSREQWISFMKLIEWKFEQFNDKEIVNELKDTVNKVCVKLRVDVKYSNYIFSSIKTLIDSTNGQKDFLNKYVQVAEIKVLFLELYQEAVVNHMLDPIHEKWDEIEIKDVRNLSEKVKSVCNYVDEDTIEVFNDEYIDGKFEQEHHTNHKMVKAFNYRVFKSCKKYLDSLNKNNKLEYNEEFIELIIEEMTDKSEKILSDKSKTYKLAYNDRDMIRKTVLILLQDCYISFDK